MRFRQGGFIQHPEDEKDQKLPQIERSIINYAFSISYTLFSALCQNGGLVIAGLGLMEISNRVEDHMEDNPEESLKILTMIMPAEGPNGSL